MKRPTPEQIIAMVREAEESSERPVDFGLRKGAQLSRSQA